MSAPNSDNGQVWAVVLEFAAPATGVTVDLAEIEDLVSHLADWRPSALFNPGRYAIQLQLFAGDVTGALAAAAYRHSRARDELGLAVWPLVRAEVLTPEELAAGLGALAEAPAVTVEAVAPAIHPASVATTVHQATRALLGIHTAGEVRTILTRFVLNLGGRVAIGDVRPGPATIPLDLSLGAGGGLFAVAEPLSVARMLLEDSLPSLLEDARRVLVLAGREPRTG